MKQHSWVLSRGQRLSVMVHTPDTLTKGNPVVVCCHGFTSEKVGANQMHLNLANALERAGYSVVRFDFLGSGDSEGEFALHTCVAGWKQDLESILAWVKEQPQFVEAPIILYGHSLGGLIVLTRQDLNQDIAARVVFAPVTEPIENFRDIILGPELWRKALAGQPIENFLTKAFTLHSQFVQDLVEQDYDPIGDASQLNLPLLIVHGSADEVVPPKGSELLAKRYPGPKEFVVLPLDHLAAGHQSEVQNAVVSWLNRLYK